MSLADFGVEQEAPERPESACVRWRECGEVVPGNGRLCGSCLSVARQRGDGLGRTVIAAMEDRGNN
jgi:hypothetical protein